MLPVWSGSSHVTYVVPGNVDPWHRQREGTRASADSKWKAVPGRDKAKGDNKPHSPLQQGQTQRHTVRATTYEQPGRSSEKAKSKIRKVWKTVTSHFSGEIIKTEPHLLSMPNYCIQYTVFTVFSLWGGIKVERLKKIKMGCYHSSRKSGIQLK